MDNEEVVFTRAKETKHYVRFDWDENDNAGKAPITGTIYLSKWFVGASDKVVVTVKKV